MLFRTSTIIFSYFFNDDGNDNVDVFCCYFALVNPFSERDYKTEQVGVAIILEICSGNDLRTKLNRKL